MNADILLVGNNHKIIAYAAGLEAYGYRVASVATLHEAERVLNNGAMPRVLLLDCKFPAYEVEIMTEIAGDCPVMSLPRQTDVPALIQQLNETVLTLY